MIRLVCGGGGGMTWPQISPSKMLVWKIMFPFGMVPFQVTFVNFQWGNPLNYNNHHQLLVWHSTRRSFSVFLFLDFGGSFYINKLMTWLLLGFMNFNRRLLVDFS